MTITIIQNVALVIAIVVVYRFLLERSHDEALSFKVSSGLLFGAAAVVSMMTPFVFAEGVIIDGRSIILAVAGFFGGPVIAAIAAAIAGGFRLSLGGAGVWVGLTVIATAALIGVGFHYLRKKDANVTHPLVLWGFGFLVHLVMVAILWFVPDVGPELATSVAPVVLLLFPLGTLLVCQIFLDRERKTEIKRHLFASEQLHRTTLLSIGDAVISSDAEGRVVLMNQVAEELTGWTQEEAAGLPLDTVFRIVSEVSREKAENPAVRALREGIIVGLANHTLLISRDGTERPIADSAAPIRDEADNITGVVLVFRDQTSDRDAQRALLRSERQLLSLMTNLPGMVYRSRNDDAWTPEFISEGSLELTGYKPTELSPSNLPGGLASLIHPDDQERIRQETTAAVQEGRSYWLNYRLLTADSKIKWVEERGRALFDDDGQVSALQGFIFDVTERKESELTKNRLETELRQAQKMEAIGRLAGGVAHDFNNMLSVINGYTELAMESALDNKEIQAYLTAVHDAGQRSADLTRQLLGFARKQAIAPVVLDLTEALEGMLTMLRRLIGKDIEIRWRPGGDVGRVCIDPAQMGQILINLVINARDAIAMKTQGAITISTEGFVLTKGDAPAVKEMPPGSYVMISVRDNGRGIGSDLLPHIFEPFFTTKETGEGTGLGLATVYGIIRQNHGYIGVSSVPGEGAEFRIYLPKHKEKEAPVLSLAPGSGSSTGNETILLVEDEISILKLSQIHLTRLGYHVLTADSPMKAIRVAKEFEGPIDLLMTDVIMPEMNGRELYLRLAEHRKIRCLYISGYTADHIQDRGILSEGVTFLQKPFTLQALSEKVRETLTKPVEHSPG